MRLKNLFPFLFFLEPSVLHFELLLKHKTCLISYANNLEDTRRIRDNIFSEP